MIFLCHVPLATPFPLLPGDGNGFGEITQQCSHYDASVSPLTAASSNLLGLLFLSCPIFHAVHYCLGFFFLFHWFSMDLSPTQHQTLCPLSKSLLKVFRHTGNSGLSISLTSSGLSCASCQTAAWLLSGTSCPSILEIPSAGNLPCWSSCFLCSMFLFLCLLPLFAETHLQCLHEKYYLGSRFVLTSYMSESTFI